MLGWIRTHPYLLVRNSLCGKRKQLEAVLNHNYWKLCLFPWGPDFWAKVFSLAAHHTAPECVLLGGAPARRPVREKAGPGVPALSIATKSHHLPSHLRQGLPLEGGKVRPHRDPGEMAAGWKWYQHILKITFLSFQVLLNSEIKSFCFKSQMTGLMKMGTIFSLIKKVTPLPSEPPSQQCPVANFLSTLPHRFFVQVSTQLLLLPFETQIAAHYTHCSAACFFSLDTFWKQLHAGTTGCTSFFFNAVVYARGWQTAAYCPNLAWCQFL